MAEKFYWADQIAEKIIEKDKGKNEYVCASGITPSGTVHIGNFREVITTDLVVRALKDKGKKVRFIYSWDDYDRFRKVPAGIPGEYEKFVGMPISEFPSPFDKKKSYAQFFEEEFESSLSKVGISPYFIRQNEMNKKCEYAGLIKTAVEGKAEIVKVLNKFRKEPLEKDWWPMNVYCEKCMKDSVTILDFDGYELEYECECGHKDKIDYRKKGLVKLKWRVDWPARWKYEGVDYEPGGIDHSSPGSSYDTSKEIVKKVFDQDPPQYTFYEWVRMKGGKEFSSSAGGVVSLNDVLEIYEPEVLRYLFVGTRPNKGFAISFDNDIIKIYDEYDDLGRRYQEGNLNPQEKRIYELSQVKDSVKKSERESFRHLVTLVQIGKLDDLSNESKERAERVANWLEKYAGDDMKFEIKDKIDIDLSPKEKEALIALKEVLATKDLNEDELFSEFYEICQGAGIDNRDFFSAAYQVLIGKTRGPRLAAFILQIGKDKVVKLLEQVK